MVKITASLDRSKVNVEWHSKHSFYKVLNVIKHTVGSFRQGRTWKVDASELKDLLKRLVDIDNETVHVDLSIFDHVAEYLSEKKELMELRDSLVGIDSGIELEGDFSLLPFQHVAVEFMNKVVNGLIADKVGLGKTLEGFCSAYKMHQEGKIGKALIIVPATMKEKWRRDIEKFLGVDSFMLEGNKQDRVSIYRKWQNSDSLFAIVSYDTIKRDVLMKEKRQYKVVQVLNPESYVVEYTKHNFAIIMDEVQKIRNHGTARGKCCRELSRLSKCYSKIGLSATYVETGLQDLFGVMLVIDKTVFGESEMRFESAFINRDYMGKISGYRNVTAATNKMKYKAIRRNKEQVKDQLKAFLPAVNESTLWVDMTKGQKELSKKILKRAVEIVKDLDKQDRINMATALTEITYLRQVAITTEILDPDKRESNKIDTLLDILPPIIEENKVIIFCFFTGFIDALERELKRVGINCIAMHGKRNEGKQKNRQLMVDKFSEDPSIPVLITSDILAEGIDAPAASYVINVDTLWNPAKMVQRCGRIDRLSQKSQNIYNINIWSKDSIEEQMYAVIYQRLELATQVIDGGIVEQRYKRLSFDDLKRMLRNLGGSI